MFSFGTVQLPLHNFDDGAPSGGTIDTNTSQPDATTQAPVTQPTTQVAPQPTTQPSAPSVEPSWLRGRLQETRQAAIREAQQNFDAQLAQQRAEYESLQRQLHAVLGVTPPADPRVNEIKTQLFQVVPELEGLVKIAEKLQAVAETQPQNEQLQNMYWRRHGSDSMARLYGMAEKSLGAPLSDEGRMALHRAFLGHVTATPELADRFAYDPTVVDEFWQGMESNFISPVRRAAGAQIAGSVQRPGIPQDSPSGVPQISRPAQPRDLDERAAAAWAAFQASRQG